MDSYEATKVVFSRIQTLDPENASKIMGYLLLQDQSEKEMIRLAFGPETHLHNLILKAKTHLGLSPTNPISRPNVPLSSLSSSSSSSSRIANNGGFDISNPSSPSSNNNPWPYNKFSTPSLSYANVVKETSNIGSGSSLSSAFQYNSSDLIDEYQLQDHLSFLNDSKADDLFDPRLELAYADSPLQRQSYLSNPGICFGSSEDASSGGLGWKPCLYFARGFCKNGSSCRFLHGDSGDSAAAIVGSPSKLNEFEQCQELLRSKAAHQQKLATGSQFMAGASFPYNKYMNFLMQQQNDTQRSAAAALMMGDELHKFGRCRAERSDFSSIGLGGMVNPGSRQIYLTFPADSIFREEDVSNYFSNYGPVQDVRIPYQQKRMFGFVTFLYPETVKIILAKGNPHFVCDSRVLVKPYKEKGKIPDKKQQQQQLERVEYLACSSPTGLDSRESFDLQLGTRMFYNTQEMLLRRKLEEHADLQQAIELQLQGRRLMNLQLLDLKNHRYHPNQYHHNLSVGSPIPSPTLTHGPNNQTLILPPADGINQQVSAGNNGKPDSAVSHTTAADADADADQQLQPEVNPGYTNGIVNSSGKEDKSNPEESDLHECLEHSLPDSLFACPKNSAGDHLTAFSTASSEEPNESTSNASSPSNNSPLMPTTSPLSMASLKNVFSKSSGFLLGMECS